MAKKEEEKKEKKEKPVKDPTEPQVVSRKRKSVLILGLTLILLLGGGVGGFFAYQTFFAHKAPSEEQGKAEPPKEEGKEGAQEEPKTEAKTEAHASSTKTEAHASEGGAAEKKPDASSQGASPGAPSSGASSSGGSSSENHDSSDKKIEEGPREFGSTFFIPIMNINLGNPLENRFLRIEVSLEYVGGDTQKAELEKRLPQYKDILISSISKRERFDLLSHDGRENLRRELLNRFNEVSQKPIAAVYFTEFLVE